MMMTMQVARRGPRLWRVLYNSQFDQVVINPTNFLGASSELLFLTMGVSFIITWAFNPEQLIDNPIRKMVGYNNPCVFWDARPATLIAAWMFSPMIYFSFRYAFTDSVRAKQLVSAEDPLKKANFWLNINWLYALSQVICSGIFVITPQDGTLLSMWIHSACFLQLVPMVGLVMFGNYIESWRLGRPISNWQKVACTFMLIATVLQTIFASTAVFLYKNDGVHVHNSKVMQCIDYSWFASLPIGAYGMPDEPEMIQTLSVISEKEETAHLKQNPEGQSPA